jgi:cytochrome o ubiquinol oxidase subunit 2
MSRLARFLIRPASCCALLSLLLAGCQPGILDPVGPVGGAERQILINSLGIMLVIVVPTILATLVFAWWFRAANTRAKYRPDWGFSGQIELVVWSIPLMTIMLLGGVAWLGSHDLDPYKPLPSDKPQLEVQVVSLDWKWLFIYPEQGIATVNELVIPAGRPVHFSLTSASVMNTFFVPQLGSMIYTMGGMTSQVHLQADQPGTYRGQSAHYSGDGFSDMHFEVQAKPDAAFDQWVTSVRTAGKTLDDDGYKELSKQSSKVPPYSYGGVADGLFNRIVTLQLPPGPGPEPEPHPSGLHGPQQAEK